MQEVKVTKIQIGLWNAIILMVTFAIASIPAALLVGLIYVGILALLGTVGITLF